ncbi:helix-turn-helix domain-containing protein [Streptomyces sp. NPDC003077]|uniref:helix-turn-helix domain-containing protein n=1 Tax=Streptomyces sp. NPDC003077 TaxID=3154443 RepID=UPI0033A943C2
MVHAEPGIGAFLKARRAALEPADVGLPEGLNRRRVRGLRREEVAQLAGISVDYYTRIEQGRAPAISDSVLDAVARALRLSEYETGYLRNVAAPPRHDTAHQEQRVRPEVRRLLDAMGDAVPAVVIGRGMDILAWNHLGGLLSFDLDALEPHRRNSALLVFLEPAARAYYPEWDRIAEEIVGNLRAETGRHPNDPRLCRLVGELLERSTDFRRVWEAQEVRECLRGEKRLLHPEVGELRLAFEGLRLAVESDQLLMTYTAVPGTRTEERLRALARIGSRGAPGAGAGPRPSVRPAVPEHV